MTIRDFTEIAGKTCCIIPMYNEEQVIVDVIAGLKSFFPHVLCIDDGSSDKSALLAEKAGAQVLRHSVNIGQGASLATGFQWVQQNREFLYMITFDADGQHRPEDACQLVTELSNKGMDVVFASRFFEPTQSTVPTVKRLLLRTVAKITNALTDSQLSDAHNGLRALTVEASRSICITQNGMAHATQFVSLVRQANLKYTELPVTVLYTKYSRSKGQSLMNSINIALDLIWE
jgi:glycosyltransferase involved in cell wall biosynthesis